MFTVLMSFCNCARFSRVVFSVMCTFRYPDCTASFGVDCAWASVEVPSKHKAVPNKNAKCFM